MRFIGITGGVGAGKTRVLQYMERHYKCEIHLADETAHLVKLPGTACYQALVELMGTDILAADGQIDKPAMADRIFRDSGLLQAVNEIIHPAVREYLLQRYEEAKQKGDVELFFVEAALLIECGYGELVDEMWYIYAAEPIRYARLADARGYSEEKTRQIMERQLTEKAFRKHSDFIIDNSGSFEDTCKQIEKKLEAFTWQE
ncbi:MAG: dephospho-CoA kinase [Eubacterium sp.]|nr:dephospho-CoA kinase [Eubacterium sp.]MCM1303979.1 dephospho-CoA kinase [Butyrivibrio sp.]MCM1383089.1 dephospho-CoA kinase [Lachnoclostridium sp.]MCM1409087.1 dephospho-CoA kinase [Lachnospiraceae bacterium]